ncbi:uncharacterized protein CEXT_51961 [Caerostris extrusa]|uniref:Uncharacterized protein n=1 Tax=Caerostris extrusa TaxID=172846 RepID=A0AAV4PHX1_CAEEX|nr:uncharacterized protein CEXT_51961 [Caerostris extrusa]
MSISRGRGFAFSAFQDTQSTELRRPGELGLVQRFNNSKLEGLVSGTLKDTEDPFIELCDKIGQIDLSNPLGELTECAKELRFLCDTPEKLEKFADNVLKFALNSKWNAHAVAIFCDAHGDIVVNQTKFRTLILRKLQALYKERNKAYLQQDKFLLEAAFACEIFYHIRIDGVCIRVLAGPIIDYLGMLVDGASEKEIEVFKEQFPKCYKNLKENDASGFETLLGKVRKQILSQSITVTARAMLLEIFELILTDWKPVDQNAKHLYESLSKPIDISFTC